MKKMWMIKYFYEGEEVFPLYVFTTEEKAIAYAREMEQVDESDEDQDLQFSEIIEVEVDPQ